MRIRIGFIFKAATCFISALSVFGCYAVNIQPGEPISPDKGLVFARTVLKAEKKWLPGHEEIDLGFKEFVGDRPADILMDAWIKVYPGEHVYATTLKPGRYMLVATRAGGGLAEIKPGVYHPVEINAGVANYIGTYEIKLDYPRFSVYLNTTEGAFESAVEMFEKDFAEKYPDLRVVNAILLPPDDKEETLAMGD